MVSTRLLPFFGALSGLLQLVASASDFERNIVDLGFAKYRGNLSFPNTVAYLGVPYAEPPLQDLRWRKPQPLNTTRVAIETGGKIVDLTENPDFCIQGSTGNGDAGRAGSEDCLKLNIYAPAGAKKGDNLPVLVYIHGGGFVNGNPANWPFDHWIRQSPNVVIASVYYRLDSFGFLSTPDMAQGSVGDFNAGFYDQIQALKFVQEHIDAFGGDKDKVTIDGQSAGGASVELHLISNASQGLFTQAIAQSVDRTPMPLPEQQQPMFEYYAEQAGCGSGTTADIMTCLRNADVSTLSRAQGLVTYNFTGPYNSFHPVLDNMLFTDYPSISLAKGNLADVPVIVGFCSNETLSDGTNMTAALKERFPGLTDMDLKEYVDEYPLSEFDSASQQFQVGTGESDVICARHIIAEAVNAKNSTVFTYRYNQPVDNSTLVSHSSELWMMFLGTSTGFNGTTTFQPQTDSDRAFASELIAYWLSFVRSGNPNTHKLPRSPEWPFHAVSSKMRMVLQEPMTKDKLSGNYVEQDSPLEGIRCDFVASMAEDQQA